ncbi:hypothetical protein Tco_0948354 [Tanacetum coccineum]
MLSKELRKSTRATERMRYDKELSTDAGAQAAPGSVATPTTEAGVVLNTECGLKASWMMPVWDPFRSSSYSDFTGVVRCSLTGHIDITLFSDGEDGYYNNP